MECYNLFSHEYRAPDEEVTSEPPNIYLDDNIMDFKFSPTSNVIVVGLVTGEVKLYAFTEEANENVVSFLYHKESCRTTEFSEDGHFLFTGSSDNTIGIVTNGELLHQVKGAHNAPVNTIKYIDNNAVIASGDDDGEIKLWDFRISSVNTKDLCVATFKENEDTITDFELSPDKTKLLATSNDGFLAVFDIRKSSDLTDGNKGVHSYNHNPDNFQPSLYALSDNQEEELTALCLTKNGRKVIVSSQEGVISLWAWDWFGDCNDRITNHTSSISTMVKFDEDTVITGCDDGYVRAVSILPNKVISIINDDMDDNEEPLPISKIAHNGTICGIVANDEILQIYDIRSLRDRFVDAYDSDDPENVKQRESNMKSRKLYNEDGMDCEDENNDDKDWEDIEDEFDESESDDDDNERNDEPPAMLKAKSKADLDRAKRAQFFGDM